VRVSERLHHDRALQSKTEVLSCGFVLGSAGTDDKFRQIIAMIGIDLLDGRSSSSRRASSKLLSCTVLCLSVWFSRACFCISQTVAEMSVLKPSEWPQIWRFSWAGVFFTKISMPKIEAVEGAYWHSGGRVETPVRHAQSSVFLLQYPLINNKPCSLAHCDKRVYTCRVVEVSHS
jgi:hypothetical protein